MESELTTFYDHYLSEDVDYFKISREYAAGLYEITDLITRESEPYGQYIKGQAVGPVTFAAGIKDNDGKSVLYNPDLLEAFTKGLAIKALWQVNKLAETGKDTVIFFDEPYLSSFGSAFSPIERNEVVSLLKEVIEYLKERSHTLVGIHCCGNTDWSMITDAGPDIISFDAFGYLDYFLLYPDDVLRFLKDGGIIAWGIIPTFQFSGEETVEGLYSKLHEGLNRLLEHGLAPEIISSNSIATPACGMGSMEEASALRVLELLSMVSKKMV
jgi:methionine synthase II (cobalamin-independent)